MQDNNHEVSKYFSKLKDEITFIEFDSNIDTAHTKKDKQLVSVTPSKTSSKNNSNNTSTTVVTNNGSSETKSFNEKKKERRKNPYTNNGNFLF